MKKTTLFKEYALDESRYKRYCSIIGVDSSQADFPAAMVADFEFVVGLFQEQKDLQDADASARYSEFKATSIDSMPSSSVSEAVGAALDASRSQIEQEVASIVGDTREVLKDLRQQYFAGVYAIAGKVLLREAEKLKASPPIFPLFVGETDSTALPPAKEG